MKAKKNAEPKTVEALVEEFQCPGCMVGSDTKCPHYKPNPEQLGPTEGRCCVSHFPGTIVFPGGKVWLGMPTGFNKVGQSRKDEGDDSYRPIRIFRKGEKNWHYDRFNVPVWAMEKDGFLFVRCYSPRTNVVHTDVIEGGTIVKDAPGAVDVSKFVDEID